MFFKLLVFNYMFFFRDKSNEPYIFKYKSLAYNLIV